MTDSRKQLWVKRNSLEYDDIINHLNKLFGYYNIKFKTGIHREGIAMYLTYQLNSYICIVDEADYCIKVLKVNNNTNRSKFVYKCTVWEDVITYILNRSILKYTTTK